MVHPYEYELSCSIERLGLKGICVSGRGKFQVGTVWLLSSTQTIPVFFLCQKKREVGITSPHHWSSSLLFEWQVWCFEIFKTVLASAWIGCVRGCISPMCVYVNLNGSFLCNIQFLCNNDIIRRVFHWIRHQRTPSGTPERIRLDSPICDLLHKKKFLPHCNRGTPSQIQSSKDGLSSQNENESLVLNDFSNLWKSINS